MGLIRSHSLRLLLVVIVIGRSNAMAQVQGGVGLDHIILYTGSLAQGSAAFARLTGVTPAQGGQHPGRGTQNALVSLGPGQYLELLAPLVDSGFAEPLHLVGWAVHAPDLSVLRERLRAADLHITDPKPGSRRLPDGGLLTWNTANLLGDDAPYIPFLIQWSPATSHPSVTSPGGCSLTAFLVTTPDTTRLAGLVGMLRLPISIRSGPSAAASLTIRCPRGEVRFTS